MMTLKRRLLMLIFACLCFKKSSLINILLLLLYLNSVPSEAPSGFTVAATSPTSITASWQLPPKHARHGIITGFKLFYVKKASERPPTTIPYSNTSLTGLVNGLEKYTEYEFQVLASSSKGDGLKSSVLVERTKEDGEIYM